MTNKLQVHASKTLSLADHAFNVVENMIVTLELAPGTIFSEAELSERIGIGRTPLREALQRLAGQHLVKALPRRGMMVTDINATEYLSLLETRRVLDRLIASQAARRATPQQRQSLSEIALNMHKAAQTQDSQSFMHLDRECDEILEQASRNPFATQATAALHAHCRRFWYFYRHSGDIEQSATLHAHILLAVSNGDEQAAQRASDSLIDYLESFTHGALDLA